MVGGPALTAALKGKEKVLENNYEEINSMFYEWQSNEWLKPPDLRSEHYNTFMRTPEVQHIKHMFADHAFNFVSRLDVETKFEG